MKTSILTFIAAFLAACMLALSSIPAHAGLIATPEILAEQSLQADRDKVRQFLDRADVEAQLQLMDVPPAVARSRVDAMTPAEVASLAQRIDALPAGGALTGTDMIIILLVAILVVLIL